MNQRSSTSVLFNMEEHQSTHSIPDEDTYREIALQSVDLSAPECSSEVAEPLTLVPSLPVVNENAQAINRTPNPHTWVFTTGPSVSNRPITTQPQRVPSFIQRVLSPRSLVSLPNQPQSLFVQALSKLGESSISIAVINNMAQSMVNANPNSNKRNPDSVSMNDTLKTPDSLTSAPPSYSFVLRQTATRRRPRLMGTFIPSPSFVNHTPPPNYAAAFDIYVDNPLPATPIRVFDFGFASMPAPCQECGYTGMTVVVSKVTLCTHFCAIFLCLFCCWLCAPLPYVLSSCKDVRHYCRNCGHYLGMYSPTNPEPPYQ